MKVLHLIHVNWLLALGLALSANVAFAIKQGDIFPAVKVPGENKSLDQESMKGKVTLINFWATWCEACKVELKEMEQKFASFAGNKDVQIAFISMDKDPAKAKDWVRDNLASPKFVAERLYMDAKFETAETLGVDSFPMTIIIDQQQKVHYLQRGFKEGDKSTEKMATMIRELLNSKTNKLTH